MTQKVKDMLDSEDLEMVRLGIHLMKQEVKDKNEWVRILGMFQFKKDCPDHIYIRKWDFKIDGENISIFEPEIERHYKIYTGRGGMEMFEKALKNWTP